MLRVLKLISPAGPGAGSMTEALDVGVHEAHASSSAVPTERAGAGSLITSTTRKGDKRRADAAGSGPGGAAALKRVKASQLPQQQDASQQQPGDTSASDDQENAPLQVQHQQEQHQHVPLLRPLYDWLHPGQQAAQHEEAQAAQQRAAQQQASASGTSPDSSVPSVSQPSSAWHGHGHGHHPASFLQQCNAAAAGGGAPTVTSALQAQCTGASSVSAVGGAGTTGGSGSASVDDSDADDELDADEFDPFLFISSLGPVERYAPPGRCPLLPRPTRLTKRKTLVLDLDETLVHSSLDAALGEGADFSFPVQFNGAAHMVHVRTRPHMGTFLEAVAARFEVVVFTASQKVYAERLLNILDPQRALIRHRIYRDSCVLVEGNYLKDLSCLGRELSQTAIVDNSPQAFGFQLANGIPIESWYDDAEDAELLGLLPFLERLASPVVADVRPEIAARFNLAAKVRAANLRLATAAAAAAAAASSGARGAALQVASTAAVLQPQQLVARQHAQEQAA